MAIPSLIQTDVVNVCIPVERGTNKNVISRLAVVMANTPDQSHDSCTSIHYLIPTEIIVGFVSREAPTSWRAQRPICFQIQYRRLDECSPGVD